MSKEPGAHDIRCHFGEAASSLLLQNPNRMLTVVLVVVIVLIVVHDSIVHLFHIFRSDAYLRTFPCASQLTYKKRKAVRIRAVRDVIVSAGRGAGPKKSAAATKKMFFQRLAIENCNKISTQQQWHRRRADKLSAAGTALVRIHGSWMYGQTGWCVVVIANSKFLQNRQKVEENVGRKLNFKGIRWGMNKD